MLILTRRVGQTVVIDDTIVVKVVSLHGSKVRRAWRGKESRRGAG